MEKIEKRDFTFRFLNGNKQEIKPTISTNLYGVDFEFARAYMFGVLTGLSVKYKKAYGEMYENGKRIWRMEM